MSDARIPACSFWDPLSSCNRSLSTVLRGVVAQILPDSRVIFKDCPDINPRGAFVNRVTPKSLSTYLHSAGRHEN